MRTLRLAAVCAAVSVALGCTRLVGGDVLPLITPPAPDGAVDIGRIMLTTSRMRAIVGAGEALTIIPTMDSSTPVDIDELAATVPPPCRFVYAETAVFGSGYTRFHKTTYQYPPKPGLISQGAAVYPDPEAARRALDALAGTVAECADSAAGPELVGDWAADQQSLHTRPGACGRSYLLKSEVMLEVTHCGFSESVADLVITNLAAGVPG